VLSHHHCPRSVDQADFSWPVSPAFGAIAYSNCTQWSRAPRRPTRSWIRIIPVHDREESVISPASIVSTRVHGGVVVPKSLASRARRFGNS
jgi:hypothetical protein